MEFIGEHLLPGQIGQFFAILSLVASLVATVAFFKAANTAELQEKSGWIRIARISFLLETVSIVAIFSSLYYIISNHFFEYKYAWQHSSRALQVEYLLSCFWEGQEGSFMLWSFWHCVLGWILIWRAKTWEAPVMSIVSFAQFCLATMIVGLYFWGAKVGSSPFVLLRHEGFFDAAPVFKDVTTGALRKDYLSMWKDGNGLNALLQNYWMVIHPPVLFLGFASTIVPFAYAIAGLWKRDYKGWTKPAISWAAFSTGILGVGIMMGAAWAYESLTFGGYWAWDPVENASLVPWLVMVAGLHTNLIFRSSGYSLKSTYSFYILAFLLILYSTFLTRSGVLGDTSVHAFTDLGMNVQLYLFLNLFFWIPPFIAAKTRNYKMIVVALFIVLNVLGYFYGVLTLVSTLLALVALFWLINHDAEIPTITKEENTYSREFWMFIGSLIFFLSAFVIIVITSLPVLNKLLGTKWAVGEDPEGFHNQVQIFVAIIIGTLTAITQYFKYKDTPKPFFLRRIAGPTLIAVLASIAIAIWGEIEYDKKGIGFLIAIHLGVFAAIYAVVANASYIQLGLKGKLKMAGASVAHIGFGLFLLGILISSSKKSVLSYNTTGMSPLKIGDKESPLENLTLVKGLATDMGKYMVTYVKDTLNPKDRKRYYEINFQSKKGDEKFNLYPDIIENNKGAEGVTPNPSAKHYWNRDIFTYLTFLGDPEKIKAADTSTFRNTNVRIGDTLFYSKGVMIVNNVTVNPSNTKYQFSQNDTAIALNITVISKEGNRFEAQPLLQVKNGSIYSIPDTVMAQSLILQFAQVKDQTQGLLQIGVKESSSVLNFVTLKAYEFPFINILWMGVLVMVVGIIMSIVQRVKQMKRIGSTARVE
ncbi:cytochrome c biogenesis protein CcsA [Segetibacter aerophilus]|uniref:Cytochrome c assembly protein n=1 Tax=Segetibacter aerophilus TaxID=670293 RepID=A0A512BDL9_9BACT|nr:cytochrome c biogenesis protein CcsA [Segetibacter aerophilus]GEO10062.1 cytochrome c assembly protein [Segetibacter aerophilus]